MLGNPRGGFLQPPALALELEQVAVMHEPIEKGRDQNDVTEQARPVLERAV